MLIWYTKEDPYKFVEEIRSKRPTASRLQQILNSPTPPEDIATMCEDIVIFEDAHSLHTTEVEELFKQFMHSSPDDHPAIHRALIVIGTSGYESYYRNSNGSYRPVTSGGDFRGALELDIYNCHLAPESRLPLLLFVEGSLQDEIVKTVNGTERYMNSPEQQRIITSIRDGTF